MLEVFWLVSLCFMFLFVTDTCYAFARLPQPMNYIRRPVIPKSTARFAAGVPRTTHTDPVTLSEYLRHQTSLYRSDEHLHCLLYSVAEACKEINRRMRCVALDNHDGLHKNEDGIEVMNTQGELQQKLDVISNQIMKASVCSTGHVGLIISEEDEQPCLCAEVTQGSATTGDYVAVFDPLDGSSNIDSGLPTGTIFGFYRNPTTGPADPVATATQSGKELVAAGYCLYSAATHLVITLRRGVFMFTLDDQTNQFMLTRSNMQIPSVGSVYTFNEAYSGSWRPGLSQFVHDFRTNTIPGVILKKPTARYIGALVADAHNILLHGGVFGYPASPSRPAGKLRLVYEANPLAALIEDAGGLATDGGQRILELGVQGIHQRTPLYFGNADIIEALEKYIK